jgi:hypothetical protein
MSLIDDIEIETHLIRWIDDGYPNRQSFYARFGILETPEQHIALNEGLENEDQEWINFDENIFYWISAYLGEKIEDFDEKIVRYDWVYVAEETDE